MRRILRSTVLIAFLVGLGYLAVVVNDKIEERKAGAGRVASSNRELAIPVETAPVVRGPIALRRSFSGTLAAHAQFIVAPKIGGRIVHMGVDLSDTVTRGQTVARLDSDEFDHAVTRAEADLAVAKARVLEVKAGLDQAMRELDRVRELAQKKIATQVELDSADAELAARRAALEVAEAQVRRAEADVAAARTRLDYTRVVVSWDGGSDERKVAERFVDTGETVSANAPLLSVVEIDPIKATIFVTETDYRLLRVEQAVTVRADAYPDEVFAARIERISPVFRRESRQARVELVVPNEELRLRPGMFVRAEIVFDRIAETTIVPFDALVKRDGKSGIFLAGADDRAHWHEVVVGVQEEDRVQVTGEGLEGRVVTLGQQLLEDGALVKVLAGPEGGGAASR